MWLDGGITPTKFITFAEGKNKTILYMNISYNWLKRHLDLGELRRTGGKILTSIGLEAEGVEEWRVGAGGLRGVVIGKVLSQ